MNDCWLYQTVVNGTQPFISHGRWRRLSDAPWSPRAFMSHAAVLYVNDGIFYDCFDVSARCRLQVAVVGGEVDTACGLPELGICVAELWLVTVTFARPAGNFTVVWSDTAVQLPFPARCGSLFMLDTEVTNYRVNHYFAAVMGGQLTYADRTCQTAPVSLNDVWYAADSPAWPYLNWTQGPDGPWSPRRSMTSWLEMFPSNFNVMGGVRYLSFRHEPATGQVLMTAAELFADVFVCQLATNGSDGLQCDWTAAISRSTVTPGRWGVAGSLPLPIAYTPQGWSGSTASTISSWTGLIFGGISTQAALDGWRSTNTTVTVDHVDFTAPVSMIQQRLLMGAFFDPPTLDDVLNSRYGLPLVYRLDEAELNNASSPFRLGAAGLVQCLYPQYQDGGGPAHPV